MKFVRCSLVPILALLLIAAAKKQPQVTIRFFAETGPHDTSTFSLPVMMQNPPRKAYLDKIAVISERDVVAIYPFPADDGTMGCAFKLDEHGRLALDEITIEKRGTSLVGVVNGHQVTDMLIDRRVP